MTLLIQLNTVDELIRFGMKPYDESLLPVAERAQSDRAQIYIDKFKDKLVSRGTLYQYMPDYMELEGSHVRFVRMLEAIEANDSKRVTRRDLVIKLAMGVAHKRYMDYNAIALDNKFNMFEWMFGLLIRNTYHDERSKMFDQFEEKKKTKRQTEVELSRAKNIVIGLNSEIGVKQRKIDNLQEAIGKLMTRLIEAENRVKKAQEDLEQFK